MSAVLDLAPDLVELTPFAGAVEAPLPEVAFRTDSWLAGEDAELRRRFAADEPMAAMAEVLARSFHATRNRVCVLGLRRNSSLPWSELEDAELARRYGLEAAATIARDLGRGVPAVYNRARVMRLSDEGAAAYDGWEDAQIREGFLRGVPTGQIAALIGRTLIGVACRAHFLGLRHVNAPVGWSDDEIRRALQLAEEGHRYLTIVDMMAAEGFPQRTKAGLTPILRRLGYGRGWGRDWTADEDVLLRRAYAESTSLTALQAQLGRSNHSLRWRAEYLELRGSHGRHDGWRGRIWTDDETELLRAEFGRTPSPKLAAKLGRTKAAMFARANALGLQHGYIRAFSADERRAIGIVWRLGLPLSLIAVATDRDPAVISKQAIRLGIPFDASNRPVKPSRGRKSARVQLGLAEILALLPPDPSFDGCLEEAHAANADRRDRRRSEGASGRARRYRASIGIAA